MERKRAKNIQTNKREISKTKRKQPGTLSLKEKNEKNIWDNVDSFVNVLNKMRAGQWKWYLNTKCKYVNLRVDMRDGGCLIMIDDLNGQKIRIDPKDLEFQTK